MMTRHNKCRFRRAVGVFVTAISLAGCGYEPSAYQEKQQRLENAATALTTKGGSLVEKKYPQGQAWVVDLSKVTIDDEVLNALKSLGRVSELNLSGSTITDDQFVSLAKPETMGFTFKLDISDTAISDRGFLAAAPLALLSNINVKGSKVTDAGVAEFKQKHPAKNPVGLKLKIEK
jgi:hypothetical protein